MARITQQDHLFLEDSKSIAALQQGTKDKLKNCCLHGSILDVVLITHEVKKTEYTKVIGYEVDERIPESPTFKVHVINANTAKIFAIVL